MTSPYTPINCEFHDVLESVATTRRRVTIDYADADAQPRTVHARIVDLRAGHGEEHMVLDDGTELRLDAITRVDGIGPADF